MKDFSTEFSKNKKWIILFSSIFLFLLLVLIFRKTPTDNYMLVSNYLIWHERDGKWYQLKKASSNVSDNTRYKLYYDGYVADAVDSQFINNKWVFFDENYNHIKHDDFILAYSGKRKIDTISYDVYDYDDSDEKVIREISNTSDEKKLERFRITFQKVLLDFDGDGEEEELYFFHNYVFKTLDYTPECYMALVKNGKVLDVIKDKGDKVFWLMNVISLDGDKYKDLVVGKGVIDVPSFDSCYQIYNVKKGKLVLKQDCLFE